MIKWSYTYEYGPVGFRAALIEPWRSGNGSFQAADPVLGFQLEGEITYSRIMLLNSVRMGRIHGLIYEGITNLLKECELKRFSVKYAEEVNRGLAGCDKY